MKVLNTLGFFVIADAHSAMAFALAGVQVGAADTPEAAQAFLNQARQDPGVGVVLITERLAEQIRPEVDQARWEGQKPLILEIPDLAGPAKGKATLQERLRALLGI